MYACMEHINLCTDNHSPSRTTCEGHCIKMTLQEKIEYISGYTSFSLRAIPRLGIPEIRLADGPQGIRNHAPKSTLIRPVSFRFYLEP